MTIHLLEAQQVRRGDLLECSDGIWRPVVNIDKVVGRIYFIFDLTRDTRSALLGEVLAVGVGDGRRGGV